MLKHKSKIFFLLLTMCFSTKIWAQKDSIYKHLDEVVVSGTRAQVNRSNLPMTISVIGRKEIEESSESALLPVLSQHVPGMFVTERGVTGFGVAAGAAGGISMRGVGGSPTTQVLVLIDGHPQFMGMMGHPLPDAYVASGVEKAEVVRGPASILYGTNAMGGVINIITRKQDTEGSSLNARLMYGSFNTQKYMVNSGLRKRKFNGFVSINQDKTDGHRPNSDFRITNGYVKAGYQLSKHFDVVSNISLAAYKALNPGTVSLPMFDNQVEILRGVGSISVENNYGKSNGAFTFFYNFGNHKINDGYNAKTSPRNYLYHSTDYNYGAMLYQIFHPFKNNTLTGGFDFKNYGGHAWNEYTDNKPRLNIVDTTVYEVATYAVMQHNISDKLTLTGGLRLEHNKIFGNEWVPQAGFAYRATPKTVIKGSVAKGFRSPTIREMYMWSLANPNLKPERMINYELSWGQTFLENHLSTELTAFIADGSNLIQTQNINGSSVNVNTGDFNNKGVELSLTWYVVKNLQIQGNYSYLHMKRPVTYAPRQKAFVNGTYRMSKWIFNASYQFIDDLYSVTGNNPVKESYGLLNAKVSHRPLKWLDIFVKGENLTNTDYQIIYQYPMPGITVFGGINISLN